MFTPNMPAVVFTNKLIEEGVGKWNSRRLYW